ncbi:hypothetical protein BABINDRAFT_33295 [Babjeviella inositovora NRRL Y-12698]|uniref:cyclic pyranopterin monophosphate synthase n=1 Tax=Babjeviella inositovora NRRL Y-12698 TaxID=984486 RepID=A0A1E3QWN0_9ASCO|nr:uncharacterized protein BABINDRAFT_33295 [Babjeviella inositovora NRRL Y-12698]ODQ81482.1 hypothetical protein BABINDRAFT_33295 [Babjeviella inositovora NRRL Y-12698]
MLRAISKAPLLIRLNSSARLTHVNSSGEAYMVDVFAKPVTARRAIAHGTITFLNSVAVSLIRDNTNKKGDVLGTARIAGIMAAKRTSDLIPLCHPLPVTKVEVTVAVDVQKVTVTCAVECDGKTGVEMEALTGATVALLTAYDMCKAVDKHMVLGEIMVVEKTGGKTDWGPGKNI